MIDAWGKGRCPIKSDSAKHESTAWKSVCERKTNNCSGDRLFLRGILPFLVRKRSQLDCDSRGAWDPVLAAAFASIIRTCCCVLTLPCEASQGHCCGFHHGCCSSTSNGGHWSGPTVRDLVVAGRTCLAQGARASSCLKCPFSARVMLPLTGVRVSQLRFESTVSVFIFILFSFYSVSLASDKEPKVFPSNRAPSNLSHFSLRSHQWLCFDWTQKESATEHTATGKQQGCPRIIWH